MQEHTRIPLSTLALNLQPPTFLSLPSTGFGAVTHYILFPSLRNIFFSGFQDTELSSSPSTPQDVPSLPLLGCFLALNLPPEALVSSLLANSLLGWHHLMKDCKLARGPGSEQKFPPCKRLYCLLDVKAIRFAKSMGQYAITCL